MKRKKYALIFACLLLACSLFGLWRWAGDGWFAGDTPKMNAQGQADYAGFLNAKLEKTAPYERDAFLYEYVGTLETGAMGEVFAQQRDLNPDVRDQVTEILALRWGETEPQAAWKAIRETSPFPARAARGLMVGWAAKDFNAARQALEQMGNPERRNNLAGELFKARARVNPSEAANASVAEIYKKNDPGLVDILEIWAESDRAAAIAFALQNDRANRLRGVFANWLAQDREAALASLAAMDAKPRDEAVGAVLTNDSFARFNPDEARTLLDKFPSPDPKKQRTRYARFFRARMSAAPQETVCEIMGIQDRELQAKALSAAVSELASFDASGAIEVLRAWAPTASAKEKKDVFSACMWRLTRTDPVQALALLNEQTVDQDTDLLKADILRSVPVDSFAQMQKMLDEMRFQEPYMRRHAVGGLVAHIYEKNPKMAMDWMNAMQDGELKSQVAERILQSCAGKNFQEALDMYVQFTQTQKLQVQAYNLMNNVSEIGDPQAVLAWAQKNLSGHERNFVLARLVEKAGRADPAQGMSLLNQMPEGSGKDEAAKSLVRQLAERSPKEAMALIDQTDDPDLQKQMRTQMITDGVKGDFPAALEMLKNPEALDIIDEEAGRFWRSESPLMKSLVSTDPAQVRAVIDTLPDGTREKMLSTYAACLFETDPRQSMEILNGLPPQNSSVFQDTFSEWAGLDAPTAMQWLDEAPAGADRTDAYLRGISRWLQQDVEGASVWLADYPPGKVRDQMAAELVRKEMKNDPEAAFLWAVSINDESTRKISALQAFSQWRKADPQAAQAALESADLSAEEKARLNQAGGAQ